MTSGNVKIVKIVPLPHARSDVWQYFGFIADDDGEIRDKKKAICKICATTLAYSGNTTNLFTHLKAMHPEAQPRKMDPTNRTPKSRRRSCKRNVFGLDDDTVYDSTGTLGSGNNPLYFVKALAYPGNESGSSTASMIDNIIEVAAASENINNNNNNGSAVPTNNASESNAEESDDVNVVSRDEMSVPTSSNPANNSPSCENVPLISYDDITNAIVNMLVEDCRPVCVTQGKGFQKLVNLLVPSYKIPHSGELKPLIRRRYKEMQRNLILRGFEDEMVK